MIQDSCILQRKKKQKKKPGNRERHIVHPSKWGEGKRRGSFPGKKGKNLGKREIDTDTDGKCDMKKYFKIHRDRVVNFDKEGSKPKIGVTTTSGGDFKKWGRKSQFPPQIEKKPSREGILKTGGKSASLGKHGTVGIANLIRV